MDHLKCRAKRLGNGEWVEGGLIQTWENPLFWIIPHGQSCRVEWLVAHQVDPATVCRYTGLKDKDGVALDWWEGDLLRECDFIKVIVWEDGCFWLKWVKHPTHITLLKNSIEWADELQNVGNRWDNPELLEKP